MSEPQAEALIDVPGGVDVRRTLVPPILLMPMPCYRVEGAAVEQALWTEAGPTTVRYDPVDATRVSVRAWGEGAEELVKLAPAALGVFDKPGEFVPDQPLLAGLARRFAGIRFGRTGRVWEHLLPAVCGQRVTGKGAMRSVRDLIRTYGESAPRGLLTMPRPEKIAALPPYALVPCGLDAKRASTLIFSASHAKKLRRLAEVTPREADSFLQRLPGIGPWTSALVLSGALGDADAVPVGDYNLPSLVTWNLAGERRGDDHAMLALLEPYRPHRGRVLRWLSASGRVPPRRGPRLAVRDIR